MMKQRIQIWLSVLVLLFVITAGWYFQFLSDTAEIDFSKRFLAPGLSHLGGTDELGRDVLHRTLQGASLSLWLAIIAWVVSLMVGLTAGAISGYFSGSFIDLTISSLITYAYATPFIIFLIALLGLTGPGLVNAYLILVLFAWAPPARHARAIVAGLKETSYVKAAQSYGFSSKQLIHYVILPRVFKPVVIASLAVLPEIIALDAVISFFGLGVQPPVPSLGKMIVDGINYLSTAWWMTFFPVAVLFLICLLIRYIVNRLGLRGDKYARI